MYGNISAMLWQNLYNQTCVFFLNNLCNCYQSPYLPVVEKTFLHLGVNLQTKRHALNLLCCFIVVVQVAMI